MTTLDKIKAEIEEARYGLINDGLDVALKIIDKYAEQEPIDYQQGYIDGVNQMVKELKAEQEPCDECKYKTFTELYFHTDPEMVEQQPCDDVVSRQAVIRTIYDRKSDFKNDFAQGFFADRIRDLPSVTQEPKTGHWIFDEILDMHYYCSECMSMGVDYWDYCPNCGARMVEPQESKEGGKQ